MKRASVVLVLLGSGCLEPMMAAFNAEMTQVADCTVFAGVEQCFDPGDRRTDITSRLVIDERAEDSRVFLRGETLVGPFDGNVLNVGSVRESVREESGCLTRTTMQLEGIVDDPGFGMRRELTGTLVETNVTDGDPQQCGRNVPYGQVKRYRVNAVEAFNP